MKRTFTAGVILAALAFSATAQDWYHDREQRFRGEEWRPHIFMHVRADLEHIWSAARASDKERARLEKTREELTKMQADLDRPKLLRASPSNKRRTFSRTVIWRCQL